MRKRLFNSFVIIIIIALSVCCGFLYDHFYTKYQLKEYPREYVDTVISCSYEFEVPVSVIYANIKIRSDYDSGYVSDDGRVGLMQLSKEDYTEAATELDCYTDTGMLYEPNTNIRLGTYLISRLYEKYPNDWTAVFAAMYAGENATDEWISDIDNLDENGKLAVIPNKDVEKYVKKVEKTVKIYTELYGSEN